MNYPPYQHPLIDRGTGLVSKVWQLFFLSLLTSGTDLVGAIPPGSVPLDRLANIATQRLLGRETPGFGPVEELLIGDGLTLTGLTLSATADPADAAALGYWTPITDAILPIPELLFDAEGDCVVGFVPTP